MPEKPRDYEAELRALMDALAESVVEATDEEIISEMREGGEDPAAAAEGVRANRVEAQEAYEKRVDAIRRRTFSLPTAPESRRKLLAVVMTRKPDLRSALVTLQHRDFKEWTDTDIQNCLEQLGALGVLAEFEGSLSDEQ